MLPIIISSKYETNIVFGLTSKIVSLTHMHIFTVYIYGETCTQFAD